ncbi:Na(+)/H(+) antiporter subunit F1 [Bacillus piscicola]|uniref:Na(+)/H(+) antiporter subunit F1 n=1 Tax=Bacillus piscicola TaxID=1632684 RepID=UPI001F0918CD|nr:Na(+)/H(+) antiporter subunit F1 [Bacillus piscicola]
MLYILYSVAALFITLSIILSLYRIAKGPSMPDRVVALDLVGINLISLIAIVSLLLNTTAFVEVILLLAILSFLGTVAFSKFIEKGVVIERNRD